MADKIRVIYMWDDPPFREWFNQDLNPGIDPKKIKASDRVTKLKYSKKNGQIGTVTPYTLSLRKGFFRYKAPKKIEYDFCMEDPRFVEWVKVFGYLNPDIEFESLKTNDRKTKLCYIDNNIRCTITPYNLMRRNDLFSHGRKEYRYCGDYPAFMEWFAKNADLNPDFDPKIVSITSSAILRYYTEDNTISKITVQNLFRKNKEFSPPVRDKGIMCWDDPEFRDWFDQNLNPDIDPRTLTYNDWKTRLRYRAKDTQELCSITPCGLKRKKDWYASPQNHKKVLAVSVPGFTAWIKKHKDSNPHIDLSTLSKNSDIPLYYPSQDGTIHSIQTKYLCKRLNIWFEKKPPIPCIDVPGFIEWIEAYRSFNRDVDVSTLMSDMTTVVLKYIFNGQVHTLPPRDLCRRKDLLFQLRITIRGDPVFWCYCIEEDQEIVNSYTRSNIKNYFKMRCPEGHEYNQCPGQFYHYSNQGRDPCPYCDGRIGVVPGVNDAVTVDPEIKLYYSKKNKKPAHMVSAYNGHDDYKFDCPYCGFEFTKRMKNIVGKYPKCPKCKDKGTDIPQDNEYMPEGIPYLVGMDTQRPKKMRKRA